MKKNFSFITIIITVATFVWYKILNQALLEEGYFYLDINHRFFYEKVSRIYIWNIDNFARVFFDFAPLIFQDNIKAYMIAKFILLVLVYITLFLVLSKICKNKVLSITATILFIANYIGSSEMLSPLSYQRFLQRVPNVIPALIAFYYLHKFLHSGKIKNYFFSLILFSLAIFMGHYASFLLPLFIIYPFVIMISKKLRFKNLVKTTITCSVFVLITFLVINKSPMQTSSTPWKFFSSYGWLGKIVYQIPTVNIPGEVIRLLAEHGPKPDPYPYTKTLGFLVIPMVIVYITGAIIVYKKRRVYYPLYLTSLLSTISIMALYVYFNSEIINVYRNFGQNRAYFLPTLTNSIVWAIIINSILSKKTIKLFPYLLGILVIYNTYDIYKYLDTFNNKNQAMFQFLAYIKPLSSQFNQNTVIVSPREFHPTKTFIERIYKKPGIEFLNLDNSWQKEICKLPNFSINNFYVLSYDKGKLVYEGSKLQQRGAIIDLTQDYKNKLLPCPNRQGP